MTRHRLAKDMLPASEREVVKACLQAFAFAGWYAVRTEANNIGRGKLKNGKPRPGVLPKGFPDYLFTLGLGNGLGLVAMVEFKNSSGGKLSEDQRLMHQNLRQNYGQHVHVVSSLDEVQEVLALGRSLQTALKGVTL